MRSRRTLRTYGTIVLYQRVDVTCMQLQAQAEQRNMCRVDWIWTEVVRVETKLVSTAFLENVCNLVAVRTMELCQT